MGLKIGLLLFIRSFVRLFVSYLFDCLLNVPFLISSLEEDMFIFNLIYLVLCT